MCRRLDRATFQVVLLILQWISCNGYSSGAPDTACNTMRPRHGFSRPSTGTSPFVVLVSKNTYEPNESIMVMLRGLCSNKFKGFLVEARRADPNTNTTERIGTFTEVQESRYACGQETSLTHVANSEKTSLLFNWTAPSAPSGHVIIKATFVQVKNTFWVGVNSAVVTDPRASALSIPASQLITPYITPCAEDLPQTSTAPPPTTPTTPTTMSATTTTRRTLTPVPVATTASIVMTPSPLTPMQPPFSTLGPTTPIAMTEIYKDPQCGITQGCFHDCPAGACRFEIAWRDMGDRVWFKLKAVAVPDSSEQWIAIGFSRDTKMGDDSVVECVRTQERTVISVSYNDHRMNTRIRTSIPVANLAFDSLNNGYIQCEFTRLKKLDGDNRVFDLNYNFYILLAQGISNNRGKWY
ncbi:putative ferric-chelate reductase 1 homolog [Gigantopelta aegis]|uniref:putative ferric-chelate reductase 1 homolog n=1 Tax=Gigantopelta aegis TaxID=1735272 RepID=UPI001B889237|nr:putative ferric-chelate reductase 1 homolog [Gigantopelta aegis]